MKTAIVYFEVPEYVRYFVVDGDYSHLHEVYVNSVNSDEKLQQELNDLVYGSDGYVQLKMLTVQEFAQHIREGAVLIEAGFYL